MVYDHVNYEFIILKSILSTVPVTPKIKPDAALGLIRPISAGPGGKASCGYSGQE